MNRDEYLGLDGVVYNDRTPGRQMTEDEVKGRTFTLIEPKREKRLDVYDASQYVKINEVALKIDQRLNDILQYPNQHRHLNSDELMKCCSPTGDSGWYTVLKDAHEFIGGRVMREAYSVKVIND